MKRDYIFQRFFYKEVFSKAPLFLILNKLSALFAFFLPIKSNLFCKYINYVSDYITPHKRDSSTKLGANSQGATFRTLAFWTSSPDSSTWMAIASVHHFHLRGASFIEICKRVKEGTYSSPVSAGHRVASIIYIIMHNATLQIFTIDPSSHRRREIAKSNK